MPTTKQTVFNFEHNRSERALQTDALAPALRDPDRRATLLASLVVPDGPISREESDEAVVLHFVWPLRDAFSHERESEIDGGDWTGLVARWAMILGLPAWAAQLHLWTHPEGKYRGTPDFVVHPCAKVGWTEKALKQRAVRMGFSVGEHEVNLLVAARMVLNTECDAFIQTPSRLVQVECKDKTGFREEQRARQHDLARALERLLPRQKSLVHVEVAQLNLKAAKNFWTWRQIAES